MKNTRVKMDITFDQKGPSIVVNTHAYYKGYKEILSRGGNIRCITEVTSKNINYCKKLQGLVSELRHIDGLKGGIGINESEYIATTVLKKAQPLTEVIYSNADEVVAQGQYIFDTLWKNSIPASRRIKEIEEGVKPISTEVLETAEEIAKKLIGKPDVEDNSIENEFQREKLSYKPPTLEQVRMMELHNEYILANYTPFGEKREEWMPENQWLELNT